jgi:hypothetical protein
MKKEELDNSFILKVANKMVKRVFPWVKEVVIAPNMDSEDFNKFKSYIFVDIIIDPVLFAETYDLTLSSYVQNMIKNNKSDDTYYLTTLVDDDFKSEGSNISDKIDSLFKGLSKNSVIPNDSNLPRNKAFSVHTFKI